MKMRFLLTSLCCVAGLGLVFDAGADPILPLQEPILQQLTNDLAANSGDKTLNSALKTYHKNSKSLSTDISILRGLNKTLASTAGYQPLIDTAATNYLTDFQARRDALNEQLIPAPINVNKTLARSSIASLDKVLSNAVVAASTSLRLTRLQSAATKLNSASNAVQRALKSPLGFSSMVAHIGVLSFNSRKGFITGGPAFETDPGTGIGEFSTDGTLSVSAIDNATIVRGIHLHVEGIGTNFPATFPLGVGENRAFYDATDLRHKLEYHFQCDAGLTNATVTNSFLSIDFIATNYLIGHFAFVGTNVARFSDTDTNTLVTVSEGEFQLNYRH